MWGSGMWAQFLRCLQPSSSSKGTQNYRRWRWVHVNSSLIISWHYWHWDAMNLPSRFFSWEIFDTIITDYEFIFFDFFDLYNSFLFICFDVLLFPPYVEKTLIPVFLFFFFFWMYVVYYWLDQRGLSCMFFRFVFKLLTLLGIHIERGWFWMGAFVGDVCFNY